MLSTLRTFTRDLLDLAYPGQCAVCRQAVEAGHRFCRMCDDVLTQMEDRPQCLACGAPVAVEKSPCQRCQGRGYRLFAQVARLAVFEGPLREMILRFKYYHGWAIGELLANRAMRLARISAVLDETDLLIPVPLHYRRQIVRGFNQADVFASRLSTLSRVPVARPLIRIRSTETQTLQTSQKARVLNMRQAFALVSPELIDDKRITLVDDVITTASTLKSAAMMLRAGNPASINVLTIAIADPKNRQFEAI